MPHIVIIVRVWASSKGRLFEEFVSLSTQKNGFGSRRLVQKIWRPWRRNITIVQYIHIAAKYNY